jgi:large subunit ribosomal protein L7/L12
MRKFLFSGHPVALFGMPVDVALADIGYGAAKNVRGSTTPALAFTKEAMSALDGSSFARRTRDTVERSISRLAASFSSEMPAASIHSARVIPPNVRPRNTRRQVICASPAKHKFSHGAQKPLASNVRVPHTPSIAPVGQAPRERMERTMAVDTEPFRIWHSAGRVRIEQGFTGRIELGVAEALALADALRQGAASSLPLPPIGGASEEYKAFRYAMAGGQKILAIKAVRNITSLGLKEAKYLVDAIESGHKPMPSEAELIQLGELDSFVGGRSA